MGNKIKNKKRSEIKLFSFVSVILAINLFLSTLFPGLGIMFIDTAKMGLDYITLKSNPQTVSEKEVASVMEKQAENDIFVLAKDEDFARLEDEYVSRSDEKLTEYFDFVKSCADGLLNTEPQGYELDDEEDSILEAARNILDRVITLAFMWRMTGSTAYAERCRAEMINACKFPDWHENHFLDTAELTFAVSLGTNWLGDFLTDEDIAFFAESVSEKAFDVSKGKILSQNWWKWSKTNWNSVCYGGLGVGAMVFYDYYPDFASEFLTEAFNKMAYNFETFTPDGVYVEGSGYWEYCTSYLTYFMSTSDNRLGTDFGLSEIDGFLKLGTFPLYITGATTVFNYGDNKKVSVGAPSLYWFSKKTGDPVVAYYQASPTIESELENGKGTYELSRECAVGALWYDAELLSGLENTKLPLSVHMKSDSSQEVVAMRSAFFDKNATYAAIKGGYNYTNHGDLDIGTFVFDSMGERWAEDLGPADYGSSGYFLGIVGGGRWKVYAKRAEGQNTLVFNPNSAFEDQYPYARAAFSSFEPDDANGGTAKLDMSEAYRFAGVAKAERTFELFDSRTSLRIKDEFVCRQPSSVYWFMHTKADITVIDAHHAVLEINGKKMNAVLSENSVGEFRVMEAASLIGGVDNRVKGSWDGLKKLAVCADGVSRGTIEVTLIPENAR